MTPSTRIIICRDKTTSIKGVQRGVWSFCGLMLLAATTIHPRLHAQTAGKTPQLARISHGLSTARPGSSALTAVHSVGLLDVPYSTSAGASVARLVSTALPTLATTPHEKFGLVVQTGHLSSVTSVAFSRDSTLALTAGLDFTARVWSLKTGREIRRLEGHSLWVNSAVFSPDGAFALTGGSDRTARLWSLRDGQEVMRLDHDSHVHSVAFTSDGTRALTGDSSKARLWSLETGEEILRFGGEKPIRSAAISRTGNLAITGGEDESARVWSLETGKEIQRLTGHAEPVVAVALSADGDLALTADQKGVRLWSVKAGAEIFQLEGATETKTLALSPDGKLAMTCARSGVARIWSLKSGREIRRLEGHPGFVNAAAFSDDGALAMTGGPEGAARLWDVSDGHEVLRLDGDSSPIRTIAFSPDGKSILAGASDGAARWSLESGGVARTWRDGGSVPLAFSQGGAWALFGFGRWARLNRLDSQGGGSTGSQPSHESPFLRGHMRNITSAAISADGKTVLTGSLDNTVRLWSLPNGEEILRLEGHRLWINSVALSPDGKLALTAGNDNYPRLWSLESGREIRRFEGHESLVKVVAFSPDGRLALTGSFDDTARLWEVETGKEVLRLEGHQSGITSLAFSPDGKTALTGSLDNTARLWSLSSGEEVHRLQGHSSDATTVAFSPDGRLLLTGSGDATIRIWRADNGREVVRLYFFGKGGWAVVAPDGLHFDVSTNAQQNLHWVVGMESFPLQEFKDSYHRPQLLTRLVEEALAGPAPTDEAGPADQATRGFRMAAIPTDLLAEIDFEPSDSRALFAGVRSFRRGEFSEVPYAVDDAVDLAHLFVFRLKLVEARHVILALAGDPQKADSEGRLEELLGAGAVRSPATQTEILHYLAAQAAGAGERGLLLAAIATHGVDKHGSYFLAAADTLLAPFERNGRTGLDVDEILGDIAEARASRRILFLDACRAKLSDNRAPDEAKQSALGAGFEQALGKISGTGLLVGAPWEGFAFDDSIRGNGVFTAALIDGLRGDAGSDERGYITLATLAAFAESEVCRWVKNNRPHQKECGVTYRGDERARHIPLALDRRTFEAVEDYRRERTAAIEHLRMNIGIVLSGRLFDEVAEALPTAYPANPRRRTRVRELISEILLLDLTLDSQRRFKTYFRGWRLESN